MQRIKVSKLNDVVVRPIPVEEEDDRPVKGGEIMPLNSNMALIAPTACGKSTVIWNTLKRICTKKTIIIAFVSTICNDANWLAIKRWAKKQGIHFIEHTSIKEDGKDLLKDYVDEMNVEARKREEEAEAEAEGFKKFEKTHYGFEREKKEKKPKYQSSKYVFIFDDLANEINSNNYETLLKRARHYGISTLSSTQHLFDIRPGARAQMRVWLLFKGLNEDRLHNVYETIGSQMDFEKFKAMYEHCTKQQYGFMYIAPRSTEYRINFDRKFDLE
jgi:hypothetical protein